MIVYLHGFNSSPLSGKGRILAAYCAERKISFIAPALHHRPLRAKAEIESLLKSGARVLVGSSLGGYYATWFCENHPQVRAVLINPAVRVADKLAEFVGAEQRNFHTGDSYQFTESHLAELRTMEIAKPTCTARILLLAQMGDETLDYREAAAYYKGAAQIIEEGGDHGFVGFERHLARIVNFSQQQE